jgi:hypothetical protein
VYHPGQWSSLADQLAGASELFDDRGRAMVADWLAAEAARIDDPHFARLFGDQVQLPGVLPNDFAHRSIRASRGALMGGIRFYGRDTARPFVEIICHSFEDLDDLRDWSEPSGRCSPHAPCGFARGPAASPARALCSMFPFTPAAFAT